MIRTRDDRLRKSGPKKLLAIDGGGIRGVIALEVLLEVERILGRGSSQFRLAQDLDYISGTSRGPLFDQVIGAGATTGDVVTLGLDPGDDDAYAAANDAILDEAERLAGDDASNVVAVVVWEGGSRGRGDLTEAFANSARARGHPVNEVLTT
jgi:hypothetical protein